MISNELFLELSLRYNDLVDYLKRKYGTVSGDFFLNRNCTTKNKSIMRSEEGLYCHHIDEDKGIDLANTAKDYPFEWQKAERLVYCNLLEHLILHMKISVMRFPRRIMSPNIITSYFGGGLPLICRIINSLYTNYEKVIEQMKASLTPIKENYSEYILLLQLMMYHVIHQYKGEKGKAIVNGILEVDGIKYQVLRSNNTGEYALKNSEGKIIRIKPLSTHKEFAYWYYISELRRDLSLLYTDEHQLIISNQVFEDIIKRDYLDWDDSKRLSFFKTYSSLLLQDYKGFGFPQFADDKLAINDYGSNSVDEYLSLAFPTTLPVTYVIDKTKPVFWRESFPNTEEFKMSPLSIVRIETSFAIKAGETPYVRAKRLSLLYKTTRNNIIEYPEKGQVMATSDVEIKGRLYARGPQIGNDKEDWYKIVLTLTMDDYELFKQKHDIRYLKILDGCYFPA